MPESRPRRARVRAPLLPILQSALLLFAVACGDAGPGGSSGALDHPTGPVVRSVSLVPGSARAGDEVRAEVRTRGGDARLRFAWRLGDAAYVPGGASFALPADAGRKRLWLRVDAPGAEPVTTSLVVGNTPPRVSSVTLEPGDRVRRGESVRVLATAVDPDGDELWLDYSWIVNGHALRDRGPLLPAERVAVGDRIEVEVRARDGVDRSEPLRAGPVLRENVEPVFTSAPPSPFPGAAFEYRVQAEDPDGGRRLRYRVLRGPTGITLDPLTGRLHWEPSLTPGGRHPVVLAVEDPDGGRAIQRFAVEVPEGALAGAE